MPHKLNIKLCLGSSCFSRGNQSVLKQLQAYIKDHELANRVEISGSLCEGLCKTGPHLFFNDTHYEAVDPSTVLDLLKFHLETGPDEQKLSHGEQEE